MTGQPPFPRETGMEMLMAHAYEAPTPPSRLRPDLPRDVEEVILRCLRKKPDERYASVEELSRALANCADTGTWGEDQAREWWRDIQAGDTVSTRLSVTVKT